MQKTAFTLYLVALIIAPLLFGAVHTYAYTLVFLLILVATGLVTINGVRRNYDSGMLEFNMLKSEMLPLFVLMFVWVLFQMMPLPADFVKWISPEAWVAAQKSVPASETMRGATVGNWITLAPYTYPVRLALIRWVVYGMLFFGLSATLNSKTRMTTLVYCLLAVGCFEVIYGLVQTYSGSNHIWWYRRHEIDYRGINGTYINRNHLAGLLEMLIPVAIGFTAGFAKLKKKQPAFQKRGMRIRLLELLSLEQRFSKRIAVGFAGILMGIGVIFSMSRGGMIGLSAALIVIGLLLSVQGKSRRTGLIALLFFVLTAGYAIYIGVERPLQRFNSLEVSFEGRSRYAQQALAMTADYPVSGIGLGNFIYAYPKYQSPKDKGLLIRHAHNDWAQLMAEAGLAGIVVFGLGSAWFVIGFLRNWKRRRDRFAVVMGAGALAALTAIVIHSYTDFNLHVPANAMVLSAVLALGSSAIHLRSRRGRSSLPGRYQSLPLRGAGGIWLIAFLALVLWAGYGSIRHFLAETNCNTVNNSTLNRDQDPPLEKIDAAIGWDPANALYWFKRGMRLDNERRAALGEMVLANQITSQAEISRAYEQAIARNPLDAWFYIHCGKVYAGMRAAADYRTTWLPAADLVMERASWAVARKNPENLKNIGNYWIFRSKTISPMNPDWQTAWSRAVWLYRRALEVESGVRKKQMAEEIRKTIWRYYPDEAFINQVIGEG